MTTSVPGSPAPATPGPDDPAVGAALDPATLDPAALDPSQLDVGGVSTGAAAALLAAPDHAASDHADDPSVPQLTMELAPADRPVGGAARSCPVCGTPAGLEDAFCEACGLQLTNDRDHYSEQPSLAVAAVSDRGLRHPRNEDAFATDDLRGRRAVLVVCDGVSSAADSELASLVGARAARDVLRGRADDPTIQPPSVQSALAAAVVAAHEAVLGQIGPETGAATTISAAVAEDGIVGWVSVGDSRVYWLPDVGAPSLLSVDDSMAEVQVAAGVPRAEAETGPGAHTITGWIGGGDPPELHPRAELAELPGPGWLCVCSDGLWNYCSDPGELRALVGRLGASLRPGALTLADALVRWANEQGGKDNVTVALARLPLSAPSVAGL